MLAHCGATVGWSALRLALALLFWSREPVRQAQLDADRHPDLEPSSPVLAALVNRSLVMMTQRDGNVRYGMHAPLRAAPGLEHGQGLPAASAIKRHSTSKRGTIRATRDSVHNRV